MFLKSVFTAMLLTAMAVPIHCFSQTRTNAVANVLDHNYKHPGTSSGRSASGYVVKVHNQQTIESRRRLQQGVRSHATPKYAARPVALVIFTRSRKEKAEINPLASARHYKTGGRVPVKAQQEAWLSESI